MSIRLPRILTAPRLANSEQTRKAGLLYMVLLMSLTARILFLLFLFVIEPSGSGWVVALVLGGVGLDVLCLWLLRRGALNAATLLLVVMSYSILTVAALLGGSGGPTLIGYLALLLLSGLVLGRRFLLAGIGLCLGTWLAVLALESLQLIPRALLREPLLDWMSDTLSFGFTAVFVYLTITSIEQAIEQAWQRTNELEQATEELNTTAFVKSYFDNVIQSMGNSLIVVGHNAKIETVNQATADLLGYTMVELIGQPIEMIFADLPAGRNGLDTLIEKGFTRQKEKLYRAKDGRKIPVSFSGSVMHQVDGMVRGIVCVAQDITERKAFENALRESETRYRALFDAAQRQARELALLDRVRTLLARELDLSPMMRSVVEAVADTFGYTQVSIYLLQGDDLVLQHEVGYPSIIPSISIDKGIIGRTFRSAQPTLIEDVQRDPDFIGAIEDIVSEVCVPLFDEGKVVGVLNVESTGSEILTTADLNLMVALSEQIGIALERARLHTEVRANEKRFRALIENSADVIALLNAEAVVIYQSPAVGRVLGYSDEELIGRAFTQLLPEEDRERFDRLFQGLLQHPTIGRRSELRARHRDGSQHWLEITGTNLLDEPAVSGVVLNYRDISERHTAEDALRRSETRYREVVQNARDVIFTLGMDGSITSLNPAFETLTGWPVHEWLGKHFSVVVHPDEAAQLNVLFEHGLRGEAPPAFEVRVIAKSGETLIAEITATPQYRDGKIIGMLGIARDITERRQAEKRALELVFEREKVRVMTEFIQNASHDFRTPLSTIMTSLYLLQKTPDSEKRSHYGQTIEQQVNHMARLVDGLMLMIRLDSGVILKLRATDVNRLVRMIVTKMQSAAERKQLVLRVELADNLPAVRIEEGYIGQALVNLLENAIFYTQGGAIDLRTYWQDQWVVIEIRDSGDGIQAADLPHIFKRFYRADKARPIKTGGTGLGLPIAKKIVEMHDGDIEAESIPGKGSTFRVLLPLNRD